MKVCRGFTLLELMITILVVAIIATVGVPGFRELIQNNRLTTQTNELVTSLHMARSEAIKRGQRVQVVVMQSGDGWRAEVRIANAPLSQDPLRVIDRTGSQVTIRNPGTVTFLPTGATTGDHIFTVHPKSACDGNPAREVNVGLSGQLRTEKTKCTT